MMIIKSYFIKLAILIFLTSEQCKGNHDKFTMKLDDTISRLNCSITVNSITDPTHGSFVTGDIECTAGKCYHVCPYGYYHQDGSSEKLVVNKNYARTLACIKNMCKGESRSPENGQIYVETVLSKVLCDEGYQLETGREDGLIKCNGIKWDVPKCLQKPLVNESVIDLLINANSNCDPSTRGIIKLIKVFTDPNGVIGSDKSFDWTKPDIYNAIFDLFKPGTEKRNCWNDQMTEFWIFHFAELAKNGMSGSITIEWNISHGINSILHALLNKYKPPDNTYEGLVLSIIIPSTGGLWIKCYSYDRCIQICHEGLITTPGGNIIEELKYIEGRLTASPCINSSTRLTDCPRSGGPPPSVYGETQCVSNSSHCFQVCNDGYILPTGHVEEVIVCSNYNWIVGTCQALIPNKEEPDHKCDLVCHNLGKCIISSGRKVCQCKWPFEGPDCRHVLPPHSCYGLHIPIVENGYMIINKNEVEIYCNYNLNFGGKHYTSKCADNNWINQITNIDCGRRCKQICQNGGVCKLGGICFCKPGFRGDYCEIVETCNPICINGGKCSSGECICPVSWQGPSCSTPACVFGCRNGGICTPEGICNCPRNWIGEYCEVNSKSKYCYEKCGSNGVCLEDGSCVCFQGFYGNYCQFYSECKAPEKFKWSDLPLFERQKLEKCKENEYIDMRKVVLNKACINNQWTYWLSSVLCEPRCNPQCYNGGTCLSGGRCSCPRGFTGSLCDTELPYPQNSCSSNKPTPQELIPNYWENLNLKCRESGTIVDIDAIQMTVLCVQGEWKVFNVNAPCLCHPPCQNGGRCSKDSNTCICSEKFFGSRCEVTCSQSKPSMSDYLFQLQIKLSSRCFQGVPDLESINPHMKCVSNNWHLSYEVSKLKCVVCAETCPAPLTCHATKNSDSIGECRCMAGLPCTCESYVVPNGMIIPKGNSYGVLTCDEGYIPNVNIPYVCVNNNWNIVNKKPECLLNSPCTVKCLNGGTCLGQDKCLCASGFTGNFCEIDREEILSCIFPFKYTGTFYKQCIKQNSEVPWCATKIKRDYTAFAAKYCQSNEDVYNLTVSLTAVETTKGKTCIFPFKIKNREFNTCVTTKNKSSAICAVEIDEENKTVRKFGYCQKFKYTDLPIRFTITGKKCIFPFIYKKKLYKDCLPNLQYTWCPVGLYKSGEVKHREQCSDSYNDNVIPPSPYKPQPQPLPYKPRPQPSPYKPQPFPSPYNPQPYPFPYKPQPYPSPYKPDPPQSLRPLPLPDPIIGVTYPHIHALYELHFKPDSPSSQIPFLPFPFHFFTSLYQHPRPADNLFPWHSIHIVDHRITDNYDKSQVKPRCIFPTRIGKFLHYDCYKLHRFPRPVCTVDANKYGRVTKVRFC